MDLFLRKATDRIGSDDALSKIDALMDWLLFLLVLERGLGRFGIGRQGYDPFVLFKCLLIGQWHGLSAPKLERASKVRLDFMIFRGFDLHVPVPDEEGFVDKAHTKPANRAESPELGHMIEGANAQRVPADKAYASKANRATLRGKHRDGIMRKAARNRPLRASEKRFNELISKRRFRVEQCFGTMKRLFGLHRARYFGVAKTHAHLALAAVEQNLLKAANKITLNAQTLAIA